MTTQMWKRDYVGDLTNQLEEYGMVLLFYNLCQVAQKTMRLLFISSRLENVQ